MSPLDDPQAVAQQYATEANLDARRNLWRNVEGRQAPQVLWEALADRRPRRVLEVGGGPGELAERMQRELEADVAFVDISPRMVELARGRGIDAEVGDVQELPFADGMFDTVVAAWMLYHVPDLDRGLVEIARVLEPGGVLVAVTNDPDHIREIRDLLGYDWEGFERQFNSANGEELLLRHFARVERSDTVARAVVRERDTLERYRASLPYETRPVPDDLELPFVVHGRGSVFVATK